MRFKQISYNHEHLFSKFPALHSYFIQPIHSPSESPYCKPNDTIRPKPPQRERHRCHLHKATQTHYRHLHWPRINFPPLASAINSPSACIVLFRGTDQDILIRCFIIELSLLQTSPKDIVLSDINLSYIVHKP